MNRGLHLGAHRLPRDDLLKDNAVYACLCEMPKVVIENPVLNSPYDEQKRHFYFEGEHLSVRWEHARSLAAI